jgi:hypothetical protein
VLDGILNCVISSFRRNVDENCILLGYFATCSGRVRLKRDGTRSETRYRLSSKRTSPFKSLGASVQSTAGSRGVRISVSNAGYTMFRSSVKSTGYPLHSPVSPSLPPLVRHRVPSHFKWTIISLPTVWPQPLPVLLWDYFSPVLIYLLNGAESFLRS